MQCDYFDAGVCRSCTQIRVPYATQLESKDADAKALLHEHAQLRWLSPVASKESAFRNKAKIVVSGTHQNPVLGILNREGNGVDLSECPLYTFDILALMPVLRELIQRASLTPYSVPARKGELKNILVTASPSGELMLRFVLRSKKLLVPIRREISWLQQRNPAISVVSINLLREHKAVVEGGEEIILTEQQTLPMQVNGMDLHLRPQSFFQTNTAIAEALYAQGAQWVADAAPHTLWDLYCGVGGFALHSAQALPDASITGIEISEEAIASAQRTVDEKGLDNLTFIAQDATTFAVDAQELPECVVVNPPRRGIGEQLAQWLEHSGIQTVVFSSCNARSLVKDLEKMPSLKPVEGRVFDMFPHTNHYEVAVLLQRA